MTQVLLIYLLWKTRPFGDNLGSGLLECMKTYRHRHRFSSIGVAWFQKPEPFSKAHAKLEPECDLYIHRAAGGSALAHYNRYYPCVYDLDEFLKGSEQLSMACGNLILEDSRPWNVHRRRLAIWDGWQYRLIQ